MAIPIACTVQRLRHLVRAVKDPFVLWSSMFRTSATTREVYISCGVAANAGPALGRIAGPGTMVS